MAIEKVLLLWLLSTAHGPSPFEAHRPRLVGCLRAMSRYVDADASLNLLPQSKNGTGSSKMTKLSAATSMCSLTKPMPASHGVRQNRTTTEREFRIRTTPTSAVPITYEVSMSVKYLVLPA